MEQSENILNQVAGMLATNQGRKWNRKILIASPKETGGSVSVTSETVTLSTALFSDSPDLIMDLVELSFQKADEFDRRQEDSRREYIAGYTEDVVCSFHRLKRISPDQARDVLEMLTRDLENGRH